VGLILNSIKDDLLNSLTIFFILHFLKKESKEGVFGAGLKVSIEGEIYPKFYNDQRK
jgi:type III secretory pathway component EscT